MTYITSPAQAEKELIRLRDTEAELCAHITELADDTSYLASAMSATAANRLRHEIRPAIKECLDMIREYA